MQPGRWPEAQQVAEPQPGTNGRETIDLTVDEDYAAPAAPVQQQQSVLQSANGPAGQPTRALPASFAGYLAPRASLPAHQLMHQQVASQVLDWGSQQGQQQSSVVAGVPAAQAGSFPGAAGTLASRPPRLAAASWSPAVFNPMSAAQPVGNGTHSVQPLPALATQQLPAGNPATAQQQLQLVATMGAREGVTPQARDHMFRVWLAQQQQQLLLQQVQAGQHPQLAAAMQQYAAQHGNQQAFSPVFPHAVLPGTPFVGNGLGGGPSGRFNFPRPLLAEQVVAYGPARLPGATAVRLPGPAVVPYQQQPSSNAQAALKAVIDGLQTAGPMDDAMEPPEGSMTTPLLRHQRLALAWMSRRESGCAQPIGGILADDQGLGKTVTTIALIASNPRYGQQLVALPALKRGGAMDGAQQAGDSPAEGDAPGPSGQPAAAFTKEEGGSQAASLGGSGDDDDDEEDIIELDLNDSERGKPVASPSMAQGGTLVICPTTVLHQWEQEIRSKTNASAHIDVYVYHGKSKGVSPHSLARFAVVLTTYGTLTQEMPEARRPVKKQAFSSGADSAPVEAVTDDEGGGVQQKGKRKREKQSDLGGPLFRVMWHRVVLDEAQIIKNSRTLAAHAAWVLKARRRWCLSGTPLQNSVDDLYSYFRFLRYDPYSKHATFKELIRDPISGQKPEVGFRRLHAILQTILLRRTKTSKIDGEPVIKLPERLVRLVQQEFSSDEERDFYNELSKEVEQKMKAMQQEGTMRQNYVNMLWMLLRMRQACNHPWLVRGTRHVYRRSTPEAAAEVAAARKLPAATRTLLAETLRDRLTVCVDCGDIPEDPVISVCGHIYCRQCVTGKISTAGQGAAEAELAFHCEAASCGHVLGRHDTFGAEALTPAAATGPAAAAGTAAAPPSGAASGRVWQSSTKVDALMEVLQDLRKSAAAQSGADAAPAQPAMRSVSQSRLAEALSRGKGRASSPATPAARSPMEKVIVFSQWTSMLDLVEMPLKKEKFQFRRLDGTMTISARQAAIRDFSTHPEVTVMLVSLKAASLGVNLVSANHVVLLDLWYNPSQEDQAIDRAHRIGQTRPVHVTRITIKGSIEDRILALQEKKKGIVQSAFGEEGAMGTGLGARLTVEDLRFLFQGA